MTAYGRSGTAPATHRDTRAEHPGHPYAAPRPGSALS